MRAVPVRLSSAIVAAALLSLAGCTDDGNEASRSAAPSTSATTVPPVSVGRISATISPEAARLGDDVDIDLPTEVRSILERVDQLLQFDSDVTVSIALDADAVIPEVGAGGFTDPASGAVRIARSRTPDRNRAIDHGLATAGARPRTQPQQAHPRRAGLRNDSR